MGKYVHPPALVPQIGRPVSPASYEQARREAGDDLLVVVVDRLIYKAAPLIPDAREWDEFYQSYRRGAFVAFDAYRVPAHAIAAAGGEIR